MSARLKINKGDRLHKESKLSFIREIPSRVGACNKKERYGLFLCDCGQLVDVLVCSVKSGNTKSCGCLIGEMHGLHGHKLYGVWSGIVQRCTNKNAPGYSNYGGRGVTICDEWRNSPSAFIDWCLDNGWRDGLVIDRIDNENGHYQPGDVRFATPKESMRNTSRSKFWWIRGRRFESAQHAANHYGVDQKTIVHWCEGYVNRGRRYPSKKDCYSERKYQ